MQDLRVQSTIPELHDIDFNSLAGVCDKFAWPRNI